MTATPEGFFYVPDDASPAEAVSAGTTLRADRASRPILIVEHALDTAAVDAWPGRLFRATVVEPATDESAQPSPHQTRASAVAIGEELPAWRLLGEHGRPVAAVIAAASRVSVEDVASLAESRHPDASRANVRAWQRWLASLGYGGVDLGDDLDGTLAIPVNGRRSPVNCGLALISRAIEARADSLVGAAAFVTADDGGRWLERTWSAAACALLEAAMAFGAPAASREDALTLAAAWRTTVERQ